MQDIKDFTLTELEHYFVSVGEKAFRAREIFNAVYKEKLSSFSEISTLPKALRAHLQNEFYIYAFEATDTINSDDGTTKYLFKLQDASLIETVLIREKNKFGNKRNTICLSSQVGCSLGCKFCATGKMGLLRNLAAGEILEEFLLVDNVNPINNIVFMGMGEPLLNYDNLKKSINIITDKYGRAFGKRKITISTSGVVEKIYQLSDELGQVNLAISLHSANQAKRNEIMPGLKENTLIKLESAINYYFSKTKNTVTLEYLLIKDFNDSIADAKELVRFVSKLKSSKVNLIHYNKVPFANFEPSPREIEFQSFLLSKNIRATLRKSKGTEISAACGQLATRKKN
ncbi:MAG: 23S rRNA (adenine(2503)-C(2))-methyltransferase RlmN [Caldisericaceae bacterium]